MGGFFLGSLLPHFYFNSGIIDPWFNLFTFTSIYLIHETIQNPKNHLLAMGSGISAGLSVLTKGPVGFFLIIFISFLNLTLVNRDQMSRKTKDITTAALIFLLCAIVTGASWYVTVALQGSETLQDFLSYQIRLLTTEDAGHGGPFYYHFLVLLLGCFPESIFLFSWRENKIEQGSSKQKFDLMMWIILAVVLIIFSIVRTKVIHYSSCTNEFYSSLYAWYGNRCLNRCSASLRCKSMEWLRSTFWSRILYFINLCFALLLD